MGGTRGASFQLKSPFLTYGALAILITIVIVAYQGRLLTRVHTYLGTTDDERDKILLAEAIAVDDRLVEMCKQELIALQNAKLLPKRCRSTLLKYLASEQRLGDDVNEAGTERNS